MLVVHANWTDGALHLWGESLAACARSRHEGGATAVAVHTDAHPFAVTASDLRAMLTGLALGVDDEDRTLVVQMPAAEDRPLPSDRLMGLVGADERWVEPELASFTVPAVTLANVTAVPDLLALEDRGPDDTIVFGHALRYWMAVARFVLELLADQRFVPTLIHSRAGTLRGAWQPWLHDDAARTRVGGLIHTMPPVVRGVVDDLDGRPWPILDEALRCLTDATVRRCLVEHEFLDTVDGRDDDDAHVLWLGGLLGHVDEIQAGADTTATLIRDIRGWIANLDEAGAERELSLVFSLREPDDPSLPADLVLVPDAVTWWLELGLVDAEGVVQDASTLWRNGAAGQSSQKGDVRDASELLISELGRAARIYPKLDAALTEAEPTGLELSTAEAAAFLREFRGLLEESGFTVQVPPWWGEPSARLGARLEIEAPPLAEGATTASNVLGLSQLVDYRWRVAVGDEPLTMEEFRRLARRPGTLVRLRGRWVELRPDEVRDAVAFFEDHPGGEMTLLEAIRLAHGAAEDASGLPVLGLDAQGWISDLLLASTDEAHMPQLEQPAGFIGELRPYQQVGLSWLAFLDQFGLGACLADDMGLGKTIQLIALLLWEREREGPAPGPTLLVVPTSVVSNWQREIARFAPTIRVHIQHGPDRPTGDAFAGVVTDTDVIITTYTLVSRDREFLSKPKWHRVVLDEAQYIKNPPTKQTATIRALNAPRRVTLTGTPVENRLSELWSIMEFCNPAYLGTAAEFRRRFAVPVERHRDQHRAEQLRRLVRPFILRRLKTDPTVIDDLPPCVTTKEYATLTPEQVRLYERTVAEMLGEVSQADGIQRRGLVLAALVKLKQICNHPAQLASAGDVGTDAATVAKLSSRSGKTQRLMQMLEEVLATGAKALVFTQFRRMGHMLSTMIRHDLDSEAMFLHGGTPSPKRQEMIDRFQDPKGGIPIFVLSLKAGGIGVNLTAASHVFHFDRWWNPAVENQATDRAFRIGQTRTVHVHKFVCLGTLEERIDQMIEQKMELAQSIVGAGEDWLTELSTTQLRELLALRDTALEAS